jgi:hypothetical protein
MGCGPTWTRHARPRRQRRSASRTLPKQGRPPPAAPDQRAPPGNRLARGSPGGVWARDIPLYRRAVPGQRHGDSPASCLFKPCARRWPSGARSRQDRASLDRSTPCLQSQIGQDCHLRRSRMAQVEAAVALSVAVRWGPAGTAVNGTVVARTGEDDVRRARKSRHQLDRRVRPDPDDTRLVGKGRRRPAAAGRWDSKPPLRWPGDRGQEREGAATCDTGGWRESQDERTASMSVLTLTAQAMQGDRERFPGRGLRPLPLQTSERRQARPHGAATVPGGG